MQVIGASRENGSPAALEFCCMLFNDQFDRRRCVQRPDANVALIIADLDVHDECWQISHYTSLSLRFPIITQSRVRCNPFGRDLQKINADHSAGKHAASVMGHGSDAQTAPYSAFDATG